MKPAKLLCTVLIGFFIFTSRSAAYYTTQGQNIIKCEGHGVLDEYSTRDRPNSFSLFPAPGHGGDIMTVEGFLYTY